MSQTEEHLASLSLLREALNYLERLPAHPMTHAMASKIRAHLDTPKAATLERRLHESEAAEKFARQGHRGIFAFTTQGLPMLTADLLGGALVLSSPAAKQIADDEFEGISIRLATLLAEGIEMKLTPVNARFQTTGVPLGEITRRADDSAD